MNKIMIMIVALTLLTMNLSAMESPLDWDTIRAIKESVRTEYANINSICHNLGQKYPEFFSFVQADVKRAQSDIKAYEQKIDSYFHEAQQKPANDMSLRKNAAIHIEYMTQLLEKIQSIREYLETTIKAQQKQQQTTSPASSTSSSTTTKSLPSLSEQILASHGLPVKSLKIGQSIPLTKGTETVGWARAYPQGIVIELKGLSQEQNMACGAVTYSYARILDSVQSYPQLLNALRDPKLIMGYTQELHDIFLKQASEIFGADAAQTVWDDMMKNDGLSPDYLYNPAHANKLSVCVDDAKTFNAFPSKEQAQLLVKDKKQEWLKYTFLPDIKRFVPEAEIQMYTLPNTTLLLTGQNVLKVGHWIAVHFEKMAGGKIGVIFADSCPYARDGNKIEAIDKIAAYDKMFTNWFAVMPIK